MHQRQSPAVINNSSYKVPFIIVRFNEILIISTHSNQVSNFMDSRPVEAELVHADKQKDRQTGRNYETNNRFRKFVNAPKICCFFQACIPTFMEI